nr:hypothetical protein [Pseudomonadota bacterium]
DSASARTKFRKKNKEILSSLNESYVLDEETKPKQMTPEQKLKVFNKLKPKQQINLWIDSGISKGTDWRPFVVGRKSKSAKYNLEKITLQRIGKDGKAGGVKHYLYNRDGKISLAIGDMGASLVSIKENVIGKTWTKFMKETADKSKVSRGRDNVHDLSPPSDSDNHNTSLCGWNNAVCPDEKLANDTDTRSKHVKDLEKKINKGAGSKITSSPLKGFPYNESVHEDAPINSAGTGAVIKGLDDEPPVKKKRKIFAGCEVFELTPEEYDKCMYGRTKYERWSKKINMEDINNQEIKKYHHKNPSSGIIIQNSKTGDMSYFVRNRPPVVNEKENK